MSGKLDWEQVLLRLAEILREAGCVKHTFSQAVIEREKEFPTGVRIDGPVNFALSHTFPEYTLENGIAIGILPELVHFHDMTRPEITIPVGIVFMLAIVNPNENTRYIEMLLQRVLLKPDVIASLAHQANPGKVISYMKEQVFNSLEE